MARRIVEFQWDDGNWPKCGKHGVSRSEIEKVISTARLVVDDPNRGERRLRAVGPTEEGRYVFVVFTIRGEGDGVFRPISARYMHVKEIESYEEAMARFDDR